MDNCLNNITERLKNTNIQLSLNSSFKKLSFESFYDIEDCIIDKIIMYKETIPLIIVNNDVWIKKMGSHLNNRTVMYTEEYFVNDIVDKVFNNGSTELLVIKLKTKKSVSFVHIICKNSIITKNLTRVKL